MCEKDTFFKSAVFFVFVGIMSMFFSPCYSLFQDLQNQSWPLLLPSGPGAPRNWDRSCQISCSSSVSTSSCLTIHGFMAMFQVESRKGLWACVRPKTAWQSLLAILLNLPNGSLWDVKLDETPWTLAPSSRLALRLHERATDKSQF